MESKIPGVYLFPLKRIEDDRGWLAEIFRNDELEEAHQPQMAYVSETKPGVVRGPHMHVGQTDVFCFVGPGEFDLYLWEQTTEGAKNPEVHRLGESKMAAVVVPPGVVHAYKCVSDYPGWVFNAANTLYRGPGKKYPPDEIRYENDPNCPYVVE